ncbi:MAG: hypothetical protein V9G16_16285 [Nitrosomonas sp.]
MLRWNKRCVYGLIFCNSVDVEGKAVQFEDGSQPGISCTERPLHNHENLAVVTEKNFQMMLIARHFGRK